MNMFIGHYASIDLMEMCMSSKKIFWICIGIEIGMKIAHWCNVNGLTIPLL